MQPARVEAGLQTPHFEATCSCAQGLRCDPPCRPIPSGHPVSSQQGIRTHLSERFGQLGFVPVAQRQRTLGHHALVRDIEVLPVCGATSEAIETLVSL